MLLSRAAPPDTPAGKKGATTLEAPSCLALALALALTLTVAPALAPTLTLTLTLARTPTLTPTVAPDRDPNRDPNRSRERDPNPNEAPSWLLPNVPELLEDMCAMGDGLVRRARLVQAAPALRR